MARHCQETYRKRLDLTRDINIFFFFLYFFLSFPPIEHNRLRIHTRVPGTRPTRVHGLQVGRTSRHQPRVPVVGVPVWAHAHTARHLPKGRQMQLPENGHGKSGTPTVRLLVGLQRKYGPNAAGDMFCTTKCDQQHKDIFHSRGQCTCIKKICVYIMFAEKIVVCRNKSRSCPALQNTAVATMTIRT